MFFSMGFKIVLTATVQWSINKCLFDQDIWLIFFTVYGNKLSNSESVMHLVLISSCNNHDSQFLLTVYVLIATAVNTGAEKPIHSERNCGKLRQLCTIGLSPVIAAPLLSPSIWTALNISFDSFLCNRSPHWSPLISPALQERSLSICLLIGVWRWSQDESWKGAVMLGEIGACSKSSPCSAAVDPAVIRTETFRCLLTHFFLQTDPAWFSSPGSPGLDML